MFRSVWKLLQPRDRWHLFLLILGILFTSLLNIGGVASIMPLVTLMTEPNPEISNPIAIYVFQFLGLEMSPQLIMFLGLGVLLLFVVGNSMLAFVTWQSIVFARSVSYGLSSRLFSTYLKQDYAFYLTHNTSDLMKNIFGELNNIIRGVLRPLVELLVEGILAIALAAFLVIIDPGIAAAAVLLLGGGYGFIYILFRTILNRASRTKVRQNRGRYRAVTDAFGAIKEVKLIGLEDRYSRAYDAATYSTERAKAKIQGIARIPRYALETLAFGGILILALVLFARGGGAAAILPLMSAYAVAGYKMMPALQRVFAAVTHIRGSHASVELVVRELRRSVPDVPTGDAVPHIGFEKNIALNDITFYYQNSAVPALRGISLDIPKNTTVGIAGPTGCGKTTLVDVILGLHIPQSGSLEVDGTLITAENMVGWRRNFGYVPQAIYLSDTSITQNIAFGVDDADIDHDRVRFVSELANLHPFVLTLEEGYDTQLGERGVRLSGGQRQRVGIARALYHDPAVLIFDEATSALDTHTETAVMEAITRLMHQKTIIIIAHRLTTLRQADSIVVLKDGSIDAVGTYEELSRSHPHFLTEPEAQ